MTTSTLTIPKELNRAIIYAVVSFVLTSFLFFIDEGYYNFNWTTELRNWVAFLFYAGSMFFGQVLTDQLILRSLRHRNKTILTCIIGVPLGLIILGAVIFSLGHLS